MNKLLLTTATLLLWSAIASPTQAQRIRSLEAIINTPLTSTARNICRSKGGNLLLQMQLSIYHCYFDTRIAVKQKGKKS